MPFETSSFISKISVAVLKYALCSVLRFCQYFLKSGRTSMVPMLIIKDITIISNNDLEKNQKISSGNFNPYFKSDFFLKYTIWSLPSSKLLQPLPKRCFINAFPFFSFVTRMLK